MKQNSQFESELKPCLIVFQVLGLQLFSINGISSLQKNRRSGVTWHFIIYFVVLFTLMVAISVIVVHTANPRDQNDASIGSIILIILDAVAMVLFYGQSVLFLLLSLMSAKDQYRIFENLFFVNEEFRFRLNTELDYFRFKRGFHMKNFCFIVLHVIGIGLWIYSISEGFIVWICMSSTLVINNYVLLLFVFYSDLIYFNLKSLKSCLKKSIDYNLAQVNLILSVTTRSVPRPCASRNLNKLIIDAKAIHLYLWKTSKLVNKGIGRQISVLLLQATFGLMNGGYRVFVGIASSDLEVNKNENRLTILLNLAILLIAVHSSEKPRQVVS